MIVYEMFPSVFSLRKEINEYSVFKVVEVELDDDVVNEDEFFDLIGGLSFEICAIMSQMIFFECF